MKKLICRYPLLSALLFTALGLGGIQLCAGTDYPVQGAARMVYSVLLLVVMAYLGGKEIALPTVRGFGKTLRGSWSILVIATLFTGLTVLSLFDKGSVPPDWGNILLVNAFMFMMVGLFEEVLFRGLILHAFLHKLGGSKNGVLASVVLSSLLFGVVHIIFSLFEDEWTPSMLAMAALKTITAAQFGMLMASLYILYRNLWALALVHGLNDLAPILLAAFNNMALSTDYTQGGSADSYLFSAVMIAIFIPINAVYLKKVLKEPLPQYGFYREA